MPLKNLVLFSILISILIKSSLSLDCFQNCLQCLSETQCSHCLSGETCCDENCQECTQPGQGQFSGNVTCTSCKLGFSLNQTSNQCEQKICSLQNCLSCDQNACNQCVTGFYKHVKSQVCLSCLPQCSSCNGPLNCTSCVDGYILHQNICQSCQAFIPQCEVCNYNSTPVSCTTCVDGFYVENAAQGICAACSIKCQTCQSYTSCLTCYEGYALSSQGQCIQCSENCAACEISSIGAKILTNCVLCDGSSVLLASKSNNSLFTCELCTKYSTENCARCQPDGTCTKCFSMYYMLGNQCVSPAFGIVEPWQLTFFGVIGVVGTVVCLVGGIYYIYYINKKPEYSQALLQTRQENH